ncbi:MAG TPA: MFS transporter [Candidatus Sulfotelmatobacter sp.]|nr:MFS transporter [Candidatus Sulfotelmatobacter sp.]
MSAPDVSASAATVFRQRPFTFFWLARTATAAAYQMLAVAVGWQIYDLTRRPFELGLIGLVQFAPSLVLSLLVGQVADRYDRRVVVRFCQAVESLAALALMLGSLSGRLGAGAIFALVFLVGAARAFEGPTLAALLPTLVPTPLFPRAAALSASATQTAVIIGPALGGLLYAAGPATPYGLACLLFLAASLLVSMIRRDAPAPRREPISLASLFAGIAYIRSRQAVLGAISLDLFAVLFGGATALLPIYARDILTIGPWGLGLLRSAPAIGALSMSVVLAHFPLQRRVGRIMYAAVLCFGGATIVFALSRWFPLSLAALALLGASDMVSVVIRSSLVQLQTPDEMRGRVSAVNFIFVGTSNQLGEFESGVTAAWFGTVPAVLIGGIATILVVPVCLRLFPALGRIDRLEAAPGGGADT